MTGPKFSYEPIACVYWLSNSGLFIMTIGNLTYYFHCRAFLKVKIILKNISHHYPQGFEYADFALLQADEDHPEVLQVLCCHLGG